MASSSLAAIEKSANKTESEAPVKTCVVLRGLPGSGKSTLARKMRDDFYRRQGTDLDAAADAASEATASEATDTGTPNPEKLGKKAVVLSADDYFVEMVEPAGTFTFKPELLTAAHAWNHERIISAMRDGDVYLVIVDNTNTTAWETLTNVWIAQRMGFTAQIREPDTGWARNPAQCARNQTHGVPQKTIERMRDHWEHAIVGPSDEIGKMNGWSAKAKNAWTRADRMIAS